MEATTYIFDRDPELGTEPLGIFTANNLTYVTVKTGTLEAGVEPVGVLEYQCGCNATETCEECV